MLVQYGLAFLRWVIGLVFAWSCVSKLCNTSTFMETIGRFKLLPARFHRITALAFLVGEVAIVTAMLFGETLLLWGFLLAALMLLTFCIALVSVLMRRIQTPCNCFGSANKPVSPYDIARNVIFILCALGGASIVISAPGSLMTLGMPGWWLTGTVAAVFVIVCVQLKEVFWVLHST